MIPKLNHTDEIKLIHNSYELKPEKLFINELTWKYLIRSTLKGKNILLIGPSGCGKTLTAKCIPDAVNNIVYEEVINESELEEYKSNSNIDIVEIIELT